MATRQATARVCLTQLCRSSRTSGETSSTLVLSSASFEALKSEVQPMKRNTRTFFNVRVLKGLKTSDLLPVRYTLDSQLVQAHPECPYLSLSRKCRDLVLCLYSFQAECAAECVVQCSRSGPWGWPTQSVSLVTKSVQVAGLDLLGNAGHAKRGRATIIPELSCYDIKLAACRSRQRMLCPVGCSWTPHT